MEPAVLAFCLVVLAAFVFGVRTAPLGLVLGLSPGLVVVGVFLGSAAFVLVCVPMVLDRVPAGLARQVRRGVRYGPRVARWWGRATGERAAGARATALVDRGSAILHRLGYRGVAVLAPLVGRWLVAAAGVAMNPPRADLYRWAVLGCATWAVVGTLATDALVRLVRGG